MSLDPEQEIGLLTIAAQESAETIETLREDVERQRERALAEIAEARAEVGRLREAAAKLASCEWRYRNMYEHHGGGHIETGRAWDRMRRAGDAIRAALNDPPAVSPEEGSRPG